MSFFLRTLCVTPALLLVWGCSEDSAPTVSLPEPPPNVPPDLVGEWGELGRDAGQFQNISEMVIDQDDVIYLADWQTPRVQRFQTDGTLLSSWVMEVPGRVVEDGPADLALGPNQHVYTLFHAGRGWWIAQFTPSGRFVLSFPLIEGEEEGQFLFPIALAVDGEGSLYVADLYLGKIQKLDRDGNFLQTWTGGETPLSQPINLDWGPDGTLFALARQNHVHEFSPNGSSLRSWTVSHQAPEVIAVDSFGLVYTASLRSQTIERSTNEGTQVQWKETADAIAIASDGTILVGRVGSVAVYRYPSR